MLDGVIRLSVYSDNATTYIDPCDPTDSAESVANGWCLNNSDDLLNVPERVRMWASKYSERIIEAEQEYEKEYGYPSKG